MGTSDVLMLLSLSGVLFLIYYLYFIPRKGCMHDNNDSANYSQGFNHHIGCEYYSYLNIYALPIPNNRVFNIEIIEPYTDNTFQEHVYDMYFFDKRNSELFCDIKNDDNFPGLSIQGPNDTGVPTKFRLIWSLDKTRINDMIDDGILIYTERNSYSLVYSTVIQIQATNKEYEYSYNSGNRLSNSDKKEFEELKNDKLLKDLAKTQSTNDGGRIPDPAVFNLNVTITVICASRKRDETNMDDNNVPINMCIN